MTLIKCDCGAKYDRMASHKKRVLGFQCSHCRTNWRSKAVIKANGQQELWFKYYRCSCGSNILNIPPKITRCVCPVEDLR